MGTKVSTVIKPLHKIIVAVLPELPAVAGDLLYRTREERLKIGKIIAALDEQERALKLHIIETLPRSHANGATGKLARVEIADDTSAQVEDWDKLYAYIKKTGAWELLNKAVNSRAVKERWDAGKEVPGVKKFRYKKVSCTKR